MYLYFHFKRYYINRFLNFKNFDNLKIVLIIGDKRQLFLSKKKNSLLIINNICKKIKEKSFSLS